LRSILLIALQRPILAHPVAPDALDLDRLLGVFASLVGQILPRCKILLAQTSQAGGSTAGVVTIVLQVVVAIFGVVDDGGASFGCP
jgi:hypothetical protein